MKVGECGLALSTSSSCTQIAESDNHINVLATDRFLQPEVCMSTCADSHMHARTHTSSPSGAESQEGQVQQVQGESAQVVFLLH